jgi:glycosyltransferase involved in cell wall biosynthesis
MSKLPTQLRYTAARHLKKIANKIAPRMEADTGISYPNIGAESLPKDAPRAIVFFAVAGIQRLVEGRGLDNPIFRHHTIHGDAVAIVKILNAQGYIVDYCDLFKVSGKNMDWNRYALIIDNWDNLRYVPAKSDQTKIAFMNGWSWLNQNIGELERIRWFKERTGIIVPSNRQIAPNFSDEHADYLTYYGPERQTEVFSPISQKFQINLCALCGPAPVYQKKDTEKARNKFMWIGGGGLIHKGLDLILEAFAKMPETELFIAGNIAEEPRFQKWAESILARNPHIHYLGWMDTTSPEFDTIANQCIGITYASCSEGGPATVARVLFNGQIPIVTPASFVRAEHLGYTISGQTDTEMIESIMTQVRKVLHLPKTELEEKSFAVSEFARKFHTREAFEQSFSDLIRNVRDKRL